MSTNEKLPPPSPDKSAGASSSGSPPDGTSTELLQKILKQVTVSKQEPPATDAAVRPPKPPTPPKPPGKSGGGSGEDEPLPTLHDKVDELTQRASRIETAVGKIESVDKTLEKNYELTEKTAREVGQVKAALTTGITDIKDLRGEVAAVGRDLKNAHDEAKLRWAELNSILVNGEREREGVRKTLTDTQSKIVESLHTASESRREIQGLQQALGDSDRKAATYRDELKKDVGAAAKVLDGLAGKLNERLIPNIAVLGEQLKDHAERTAPVLDDVNRRVEAVESSLKESVVPQLAKSTEAVSQLSSDTRLLDKRLQEAHTQLQQTLRTQLDERLDDVVAAADFSKFSTDTQHELKEATRRQEQAQKTLDGLYSVLPGNLVVRLDKLADGLTSLAGATTTSGKTLAEVAENVENLEKLVVVQLGQRLDEVEHAIAVAQMSLDTAATTDDVQRIAKDLEAAKGNLLQAIELTETRLGSKLDMALEFVQQVAGGAATSAQGVGELKEPVGAVKRSVGDALEYRLSVVQRDLGELGREVKGKLDALAGDMAQVHGTLARTVVPGLEQARAATEAVGARLDKRSERLEAVVVDAAKTAAKALRERLEAVAQSISQLGSQRSLDQAALVQLLHQLRSDVAGPLDQLGATVADGLTPRIDSQTAALAELHRSTTQRLGELSTTLTTVKQSTSSLSDDLSAALSTLDKLAAAVPLHQTTLLGELASLRTMTRDGLIGTLRSSSKDLKDHVLALDGKVESRVDAVKSQLGQLADRGAQQHAQVVAEVSAIRDLVRTDSGTQSRLGEAVSRKLDDTLLYVKVLATDAQHQHEAVLSNFNHVQSAVTGLKELELFIEKMVERLRTDIQTVFDSKTKPVYDYINILKEAASQNELANRVKEGLTGKFNALETKLSPLEELIKNESRTINSIKSTTDEVNKKTDIILEIKDLVKAHVPMPSTGKQLFITCSLIIVTVWALAGVSVFLKSRGIDVSPFGSDAKFADILKCQEELKKNGEKTDKVLGLAEKTSRKLGCADVTLDAQLADIKALLPKSVAKVGKVLSPPPITNSITVCSSCGPGGPGSGSVHCTCLGKTTNTPASEQGDSREPKEQKPAPSPAAAASPKK